MGIESFIRKVCVQTAVYWGSPVNDGTGGYEYADPVEIKVRWDEKYNLLLDTAGKEVQTDVEILCPEDLVLHGQLYLGFLTDLDDLGLVLPSGQTYPFPSEIENAYEILGRLKVSMPKSLTEFIRTYYLNSKNR